MEFNDCDRILSHDIYKYILRMSKYDENQCLKYLLNIRNNLNKIYDNCSINIKSYLSKAILDICKKIKLVAEPNMNETDIKIYLIRLNTYLENACRKYISIRASTPINSNNVFIPIKEVECKSNSI